MVSSGVSQSGVKKKRVYASSKLRVGLLAALMGAMFFVGTGWAQDAGAGGGGAAPAKGQGLVSIVLGHIDPIFIIIAALSVVGLTLIIQGFIKNRRGVFMPDNTVDQIREMIQQKRFKELIEFTENDPSFVSRALNPALKRAPSFSSMKEAMETSIGEQTAEKFRSIEYLNIIGNLGPLLGLTGTVLGMIEAFSAMQAAQGAASPADLAGGISRALAHTFLGLFLAVPCLACFGILRTIVDRLTVRAALVCEELLLMVKPQEQVKPGAPAVRGPGMPAPRPPVGAAVRPPVAPPVG
jgi:biopolymer transport protein ExbB